MKWMNLYTKVLSKFASTRGLKLTLKVEVGPEGGVSQQKSTKRNQRFESWDLTTTCYRSRLLTLRDRSLTPGEALPARLAEIRAGRIREEHPAGDCRKCGRKFSLATESRGGSARMDH